VREGSVARSRLVDRLRRARVSAVAISAPAGYGKTTTLAQWAARDRRAFAWLALHGPDDDPAFLVGAIAEALEGIRPDTTERARLDARSARSSPGARLAAALSAASTHPFVLVLDDVHLLRSRPSVQALATLAELLPDAGTLVLCGRGKLTALARLRSQGRVLDLDGRDLAFDVAETRQLLSACGLDDELTHADGIAARTEGWPAGVYLAGAYLAGGRGDPADGWPGGDDPALSEYLRAEVLPGLTQRELRFLTRTCVAERVSGPLCDAMLQSTGSAATLESLARRTLFVFPEDGPGSWFRYHTLLREVLRRELEGGGPALVRQLNARASRWLERNGEPEAAIALAQEAGNGEDVARLVTTVVADVHAAGRSEAVEEWFDWLERNEWIERYAPVAVVGSWLHAVLGHPAKAERWARVADRASFSGPLPDGSRSIDAWRTLLRAILCAGGVEAMESDATAALELLSVGSEWLPTAMLTLGVSRLMQGRDSDAEASLADAFELAVETDQPVDATVAQAVRASQAARAGDWMSAEQLSERAQSIVERAQLYDYVSSALALAFGARVAIRRGDPVLALERLAQAQRLRPLLSYAIPWYALLTLMEMARGCVALADPTGARTLLREANDVLARRPRLGMLSAEMDELREQLRLVRGATSGVSSLTSAELRLLPALATHRSFREIGTRLHVSPHTVKSQAISLYRKLGVGSRGEAVERARELGLVAD
jgi:LuxR family maltose regulon positive regulatory protein